MSKFFRPASAVALGLSFAVAGGFALPVAAKEKPAKEAKVEAPKASKEFMPMAAAMDKALKASDWAALDAALAQGGPAATTPGDKYFLGFYTLRAGINAKDIKRQAAGLDMLIESPMTPAKDLPAFYFFSGNYAYQGGEYPKAVERLLKAKELGSTEPAIEELVLESYFNGEQFDAGIAFSRAIIARENAAGRVPADTYFVKQAQALQRADRDAELVDVLAQRVAAHPSKENWRNSIIIMLQRLPNDKEMTLDSFRLLRASGSMVDRREYLEYAQAAADEGLPGEVTALITQGRDSGIVAKTDKSFNEIFDAQNARVAGDRAGLKDAEDYAVKATTAKIAKSSADLLLSYGEYARAITVYQTAMGKSGADADALNLKIGMAQALAGQYDAGIVTLGKVAGMRAPLAKFWTAYAKGKSAPASVVPAMAATPAT